MNCADVRLDDLVHGFLDEPAELAAREHVHSCPDCGAALRRLEGERDLLCAVLEENRAEVAPFEFHRPKTHVWGIVAMAASILVCTVLTWMVLSTPPVPEAPRLPAAPQERIRQIQETIDETYSKRAEEIRTKYAGKFVVIVDGKVLAPFENFADAKAALDKESPDAQQAFLYQAGVEDRKVEFALSPWIVKEGQEGNWLQCGQGFVQRAGGEMLIGGRTLKWTRHGKSASWPMPDISRIPLAIADPTGTHQVQASYVMSMLFEHDVTVTEEQVAKLGLNRFRIPEPAVPKGAKDVAYGKVRCRIQVPELDVDEWAIAFVVPERLRKGDEKELRDSLQLLETLDIIAERTPDVAQKSEFQNSYSRICLEIVKKWGWEKPLQSASLVFVGTIEGVGQAPGFWSGALAAIQRVTYRVDRVLVGESKEAKLEIGYTIVYGDPLVSEKPELRAGLFPKGARGVIFVNKDVADQPPLPLPQGVSEERLGTILQSAKKGLR